MIRLHVPCSCCCMPVPSKIVNLSRQRKWWNCWQNSHTVQYLQLWWPLDTMRCCLCLINSILIPHLRKYSSFPSPDIVGIGFQQKIYSVSEHAGSVLICAVANVTLNGSRTASGVMKTKDVSAEGQSCSVVCVLIHTHDMYIQFLSYSKQRLPTSAWADRFPSERW